VTESSRLVRDSERVLAASALSGMGACIADVRRAVADSDRGPQDPTNFNNLRGRLSTLRETLPPLYRETFFDPFVATINGLGPAGFQDVLLNSPNAAMLMMDAAHAILQNGEGYQKVALDAFQEVVSDLYDGFLSAEDRAGVKAPDRGVIPPLVKFGNPEFGPYTWPIEATASFALTQGAGLGAGIVNLPPANGRMGLLAWAALGHETGGHDILSADTGLKSELTRAVEKALVDAGLPDLGSYWSERIDETASDVLGILNMGPVAGMGLIAFFRGLSRDGRLRNNGPSSDSHPADILRGFLAAATVRLLSFDDSESWADLILGETQADLVQVVLAGREVSSEDAQLSAELVARAIATTPLQALENTALIQIQDWRAADEDIAAEVRELLVQAVPIPTRWDDGVYAAHVVAAAGTAALAGSADVGTIFQRMLAALKSMHDANPSAGPLFVAHPGNMKRHHAYVAA